MARRPAGFILWTDDALSSSRIAMMTDEEFRAYMLLLWHCWNLSCSLPGPLPGSLPDPLHPWLLLAGRPVSVRVQSCFIPHPDRPGYYTHPKLYKQLLKREQTKCAGESSARVRWGNERCNESGNERDNETGNEHGNESDASSKPTSLPIDDELDDKSSNSRRFDFGFHIRTWNTEIAPLIGARTIESDPKKKSYIERKAKFRTRLKEYPDLWERVREECRYLNEFMRTRGHVTFDFICSPSSLTKLLEGTYRNEEGKRAAIRTEQPTEAELAAAYTPPPGSPRGWVDPPAKAAGRIDMDGPEREEGED